MVIDNETRLCALEQLKAFLEGTGEVRFQPVEDDEGRYSHLQAVLKRFAYPRLKRANKGLVLRYLGRTTGYSQEQLTPAWCASAWPPVLPASRRRLALTELPRSHIMA